IPYGQTASYLDIARALDNQRAVRAVGAANGKNKIPIIIPCHRVIGSDGSLIGFGGGIWRKKWLLQHEKIFLV
ncbi:MAG: methylated-DNA--[protein]-cysteine S-methyltransferase, partial [bacterium]